MSTCASCRHFQADRAAIEAALPGLTVLGSAYASVTAGDGICTLHDTYLSRRDRCADHTGSAETLTSNLPKLRPDKMPVSASGAFSNPSITSSR